MTEIMGAQCKTEHFQKDMKMAGNSAFFYHPETGKRALLGAYHQKKNSKDGADAKAARSLGQGLSSKLHAMKTTQVELAFSDEFPSDLIPDFQRGFNLANYEYSLKTDTKIKEAKKNKDDDKDEEPKDERNDVFKKIFDVKSY
jgi:hypothetical protein